MLGIWGNLADLQFRSTKKHWRMQGKVWNGVQLLSPHDWTYVMLLKLYRS